MNATRRSQDHRRRLAVATTPPWWDPASEGLAIWAAYKPKGAADLASSYTDVSGQGRNAGVGVAPTWDSTNGWKFDGSTQYLTTTFVPDLDQSQTVLIQYTNIPDGGTAQYYFFGMNDPGKIVFCMGAHTGSTNRMRLYNGGSAVNSTPKLLAGNMGIAGATVYRNGVAVAGALGVGGSQTTWTCDIGRGWSSSYQAIYIQALALYTTTLTPTQIAAIVAAMAAL